ncbi:MAG: asparagine synthase-related protein, partial [Candidatus Saccharibacteria bacterium]
IIFASEIKPLLASGIIDKKPNDKTIYRYLKFRIHDDSNATFFDGINKLAPGQLLAIDKSGLSIKPFTKLKEEILELSSKQLPYTKASVADYKKMLIESVRLRLQSEVPVGTSLSGGLDSSAVATIINQLMQEKGDSVIKSVGLRQNTFSAIFPNSANDEERYVDAALDKFKDKVIAHKIEPTADEFAADLEDFIKTQEEPIISTGPYAQYQVMRVATEHVTVLLDGQGADEMMAGYIPYYFVYLKQLKSSRKYIKLIFELIRSADVLLKLGRFWIKNRIKIVKKVPVSSLLNKSFSDKYAAESFKVNNDNLKQRLVEDIFHNSLPSLLRYEDKNTMRFSLEGRVPFLDKEVIKFLFSLSDESIIKNGWNKRILRDAMDDMLPDVINRRRNKIGFTTPESEWFMRLKNRFYHIFMSSEFASRPYFNQDEVIKAFEGYIQGKNDTSSLLFWRLLNVELWLQEFFDEKKENKESKPKTDFEPNEGKSLDIKLGDKTYRRYPIRTDIIKAEDKLEDLVTMHVTHFFEGLKSTSADHHKMTNGKWYFFISEKIVAITQGRSYFIWDINPSWWAKTLSKFVTKTPYGIGLGSPFTMELAIREVGLPKILYASIGGFIGKIFGKRGVFYNLVGENIRAIDGPTEYSVYPSNVSAKLAPKDPSKVAEQLSSAIRKAVPKQYADTFGGTVVIDSNDIGRNALGKDADGDNALFEDIFSDNPLGQSSQQTPIAIIFRQD